MNSSQDYLRCRESKRDELMRLIQDFIDDNFIIPGRDAIDSAISDAEEELYENDQEISELQNELDEANAKIEELEQRIAELENGND